jgi:hypothetical protein
MSGLHAWVGDTRKCDAAILIEQTLAIQELLEAEWGDASEQELESMAQLQMPKQPVSFWLAIVVACMDLNFPKPSLTT